MPDLPERQTRQQAVADAEPTPLLSEDALAYVDQLHAHQLAAKTNPLLDGRDAQRRLGDPNV